MPESKLPLSWDDVSLKQFIELKQIEQSDFGTPLSYRMEQLYILTDTDIDDSMWDDVDSVTLLEEVQWLQTQPSTDFKRELMGYHYKDLSTITLGEWIDLEHFFSINYFTELPMICAILFRRHKTNDWGHTVIEPRTYDVKERSQLFLERPITDVYGIIQAFLKYKQNFLDMNVNLFEEPEDDIEIEDVSSLDALEMRELREAEHRDKLVKKWNWEQIIYKLSNENILHFDAITELSLVFVFNQLSMMKDLKI